MSEKLKELEALSEKISLDSDSYLDKYRIASSHHLLYGGNAESDIMVLQMHPDKAELNWGIRNNLNKDYVCFGPAGNIFKDNAKKAGFDIETDFFYCNYIPFYPLAGSEYDQETKNDLSHIFKDLMNIIDPKIIITLGHNSFNAALNYFGEPTRDFLTWESYADSHKKILKIRDDIIIAPIEDPNVVISESHNKNKAFYNKLKILYTVSDHLIKELEYAG